MAVLTASVAASPSVTRAVPMTSTPVDSSKTHYSHIAVRLALSTGFRGDACIYVRSDMPAAYDETFALSRIQRLACETTWPCLPADMATFHGI